MPVLAAVALVGAACGFWFQLFSASLAWIFLLNILLPLGWWLFGAKGSVFLLGWCFAGWLATSYPHSLLSPRLVSQDIYVRGCVADAPRVDTTGSRFLFRLYSNDFDPDLPRFISLRVYGDEPAVQAAECWQLVVRLKRPSGLANPGSIGRELRLFADSIGATGYVRSSRYNRRVPDISTALLLKFRWSQRARIRNLLNDSPAINLIPGIVLGLRTDVVPDQWKLLRDTGTSHLMAISGLHIGLVAGMFWLLVRKLCLWLPLSWLNRHAEELAAFFCIGSAFIYSALAGFSAPTNRAVGMLIVALILRRNGRDFSLNTVLATVFLMALLAAPSVIFSTGFWLSHIAVWVLLNFCRPAAIKSVRSSTLSMPERLVAQAMHAVGRTIQMQRMLFLGLLLPVLLLFDQVSLIGPVANLVAVPWFSVTVLPLLLAGSLSLPFSDFAAKGFFSAGQLSLDSLLLVLGWFAGMPFAVWAPISKAVHFQLLIFIATAVLMLRRSVMGQTSGAILLLSALTFAGFKGSNPLRINVLDVGQGTSILVRTRAHAMLIDTGPAWATGDAGASTVVPALSALGVRQLDMLLLSHADGDHAGGAASILKRLPVRSVFTPPGGLPARFDTQTCVRGTMWKWDDVQFRIIHPAGFAGWSENDASCVLLIETGGQRIMLSGDIEAAAESVLVAREKYLSLDLVVVPHHGSATSSSEGFVKSAAARYAVVTAGNANRWGFPNDTVVSRWLATQACLLNTAVTGGLTFEIGETAALELVGAEKYRWIRPWPIRMAGPIPCDTGQLTL